MDANTNVTRIPSVEEEPLFPLQTHQEEGKVPVNEQLEPSPNLVLLVPDQYGPKPPTFPVFSPATDQEMATLGDLASGFSRVVEKIETLSLEPRDSCISEVDFESNGRGSTKIETLCLEPRYNGISGVDFESNGRGSTKVETLCLEPLDNGISEVAFESNGGGSTRKQEDVLEAKMNLLLMEHERCSLLKEKTCEDFEGVLDVGGRIMGCLRGIGSESVGGSLKIEVIDDTALVIPVGVLKSGNGGRKAKALRGQKKKGKMCENGDNDRRKAKSRYHRKRHRKREPEVMGCEKKHSCIGGARKVVGDGVKVKYSRGEMERLRFVKVVEQRKMWKGIYTGLEASVREGYDDLASSKHQMQKINLNFDPRRQHQRRKDGGPGILGPVAGWGRMDHLDVYVH